MLLILHRVRQDDWHAVAGSPEEDETFADAAARELREETGLVAMPIDLRLEQTSGVVIGNFHVYAPDGWEPVLNEEHNRHDWTTFAVARELTHRLETQQAIDLLAGRLRTRVS